MESEITQTPSIDYPALLRQFFESEELTDAGSQFPSDPETWRYLSYVIARDYPESSKGKKTPELKALGQLPPRTVVSTVSPSCSWPASQIQTPLLFY